MSEKTLPLRFIVLDIFIFEIFPGREEGTNRFFQGGRKGQTDFSMEAGRDKQIFPGRERGKNRFFQGGRDGKTDFSREAGRDK